MSTGIVNLILLISKITGFLALSQMTAISFPTGKVLM